MPFGLLNVPASFQIYINKILAKKLDVFVIVYLNDILIYTKDGNQAYVNAVWWILKKLRKYGLFANLKKYCFYKNKVCFLEYVMLAQKVQIEEKKIEAVKKWLKLKSIQDI